ncbi:MAG: SCO family protein [Ilumatobacteraceae bacterium]
MAERSHRLRAVALAATCALTFAACSSDDATGTEPTPGSVTETTAAGGERVLAGVVREPLPVTDDTVLPSLSSPGEDAEFRAAPGELRAVYFGYTNCPDVCPTTMADWSLTLRRLPEELAANISTVMVTVDPDRDNDILTDYVRSFVADGEAAGTTDADLLATAAEPFGVQYSVTTADDGAIEVSHSGFLYLVDDQGLLRLSWPFGTSAQEMADDVVQIFDEVSSP